MSLGRVYTLDEVVGLTRVIPRRPALSITGLVLVLVGLVGAALTWSALTWADLVVRAPARVRAKSAATLSFASSSGDHVFAPIAGRVATIRVVEGQPVKRGDVLATLDATELANDLARFEAALRGARAQRDAAVAMQDVAVDARLARSELAFARRDLRRVKALERDGAASRSQVDEARSAVGAARARAASARSDWAVKQQELVRQVATAEAELLAADKRVANARLALEAATIRADAAGIVSAVSVGVADPVQPAKPMFTITPDGGLRVDAAVAAAEIADLRVGMRVRVRLDAFDAQQYGTLGGTIAQISSDAETLGQPGGVQVSVYAVRIDLDAEHVGRGTERHALKLGMTGTVDIVTDEERLLFIFIGRLRKAVAL